YRSMEDYGEAKKHIFKYQRKERGDYVVLNSNDPIVSQWAGEAPAGVVWFGLDSTRSPGVAVIDNRLYLAMMEDNPLSPIVHRLLSVTLCQLDDIKVPGEHNRLNAACAAMLATLAGAPQEAVQEGLRSFRGVADRLEY